ncbi:MAG: hypothetical protein H7Y88_03675 [Phycisphaerales bacterium]|nr:hypothetical protein [Phycisphaerales bacterium]
MSAPIALLAPASPLAAQLAEPITEQDVIAGTMNIEFKTRTNLDTSGDLKDGSAALGAQDKYTFDLTVAKTTQFSGDITRQPNLYSRTLSRRKQDAALAFSINMAVLNPKDLKQKKNVGKWVGLVPIDSATGAFDLGGGAAQERPLRIAIDAVGTAKSFTDPFAGKLVGKAEKKDTLAAYTYKRVVGNKTVQMTVKKVDPMRFDNIVLAKGPAETYPRTVVSGRLDYDYETGNWFTDGIRFKYTLEGKEYEDVITGSIKWIEDTDRSINGKGYYDFNLRFNEDKNKSTSSESAAFEKMDSEEAFFFVDDSVPCMTGRITYVDTMAHGSEAPASSKVEYHLNANKLTKQQVMNFFKLWMLGVGPTNDE